jgi:hypothetical protein
MLYKGVGCKKLVAEDGGKNLELRNKISSIRQRN